MHGYRPVLPPNFGILTHDGDANKPPEKKKKHTLDGVPIELDIKYAPIRVIGRGSYGVVCSCLNEETNERVAVKKIGNALTYGLSTLREIQILRQMKHQNVMSLKDVMVSSSTFGKYDFQHVYLVQELMYCDLGHVIGRKLSRDWCKPLLFQILMGVRYLHAVNVIHRDLKPQNILLKKNLDLKISDFGLSRTKNQDSLVRRGCIGTFWYRAPELLLECSSYGSEIDMWSVGCIFAEMIGGFRLFKGADSITQIKEINMILGTQSDLSFVDNERSRKLVEELPFSSGLHFRSVYDDVDPMAIDLLMKMLQMNPSKRISAAEALKHPYFSEFDDPMMKCSAPKKVELEVDERPHLVNEKMLRESIWEEMLRFHPEERVLLYSLF